jgi:dethiobiotin synthetase
MPTPGRPSDAPRGVFITGTDTGVGKTYLAAHLIRALAARGVAVVPRKPVESGCKPAQGQLWPADGAALQQAAGGRPPLQEVCPWRLRHALSPARAAELEGVSLGMADLIRACQVDADRFLVVEGAGGFYSPLTRDGLNADLAQALGRTVVIVAADRLGCINQVLLNAEAVRSRGLALRAIVLNATDPDPDPLMNNASALRAQLRVPLCPLDHDAGADSPALDRLCGLLVNAGEVDRS